MEDRKIEIKNFIGVYDNFILPAHCKELINFYEERNKFSQTFDRMAFENQNIDQKQDKQYFAKYSEMDVWIDTFKPLIVNFDLALQNYLKTTGALTAFQVDRLHYSPMKIQKTLPGQGYHVWHIEKTKGLTYSHRALVWSIYLNDVEEGGETEFLHFSTRVKPKTGRIVIWPADFPYLHRGNPPLSGEKYLLTSWMFGRENIY
tara:strand:+ start:6363 stop:6971 length:609 start_codon:yes stop_codon:yes gene_type:complete